MARSTKRELYMRRVRVVELLLKGKNRDQIINTIKEEFKVGKGTITNDLKVVEQEMTNKPLPKIDLVRTKSLDRLEMLFENAVSKGHLKTALDIQKEIDKVSGLHNPEAKSDDGPKIFTVEEKKKTDMRLVPTEKDVKRK